MLFERRSFSAALLTTTVGLLALIFTPFTLGLSLLLFVVGFLASPRRIWARDGAIYADKGLPANGLRGEQITDVKLYSARLLFWTTSRSLAVYFKSNDRPGVFGLSTTFAEERQFEQVVEFVTKAWSTASSDVLDVGKSSSGGFHLWRYALGLVSMTAIILGIAGAGLIQFTRLGDEQAALRSIERRLAAHSDPTLLHPGETLEKKEDLREWSRNTEEGIAELRVYQAVAVGIGLIGLALLCLSIITRKRRSP